MPFPQSSNPSPSPAHTPSTTAGASSSSFSSSASTNATFSLNPTSANKDRPLTSASLLKANAAAPDPKAASLEQAVNERNVLSAQNAQLWKLIEKQRAGYNQILKELERVRAERDALKAKFGGSSSGQGRKSSEGEQPAKRSFSQNADSAGGARSMSGNGSKQTATVRTSDDQRMFFLPLSYIDISHPF